MGEAEVLAAAAQFGTAGLVLWMWMTERRASAARERLVAEAHERLMQERPVAAALMALVADNTRALAALEAGQRELVEAVKRAPRRRSIAP